ncbi:MAG: hypothetical protein GXY83_18625 [Rhodopirellula sp.]|nr:hypothetical protein [Rhodopirellula sp.]
MKLKPAILAVLGRDQLKRIVASLEVADVDRRSADAMREALAQSRRCRRPFVVDATPPERMIAIHV